MTRQDYVASAQILEKYEDWSFEEHRIVYYMARVRVKDT
jgi:hypothetical protein